MAQRHLLPILGKRLVMIMFTFFVNRSHPSSLHFVTHHPGVFVITHLNNSCPMRFLRLWALCLEVAFFATVKTRPVSSTCFASIDVHGVWVPLRGQSPCWWGRISARPGIGSWRILTFTHEHLIFSPSPVNGDCRVLPIL